MVVYMCFTGMWQKAVECEPSLMPPVYSSCRFMSKAKNEVDPTYHGNLFKQSFHWCFLETVFI